MIATFLFSVIFYALTDFSRNWTSSILFATLILFGALGFYDDLQKFFSFDGKVVLKELWQKDMASVVEILTQTLLLTQKRIQPFHPQALLPRLRQANLGMAREARVDAVNKRRRIMRSYLS